MSWHANRFIPDNSKVHLSCLNCGRGMWLPESKFRDYKSCSAECNQELRRKVMESRRRPCETCGTPFIPRPRQLRMGGGRFCSRGCNTVSKAALNTNEAKSRAKAVQAEMHARGDMNMAKGERNANWKGGVNKSNGYILIKINDKYVPEHRLIMERHLGRSLDSDEVVHHINHEKTDNRIENLQAMSRAEHMEEHRDDILKGLRSSVK